jgi:peptidoglycan/LPS O-acetylase OafA/YrhL
MVICYHFKLLGAKSGFLGVDAFFVLSGYLMAKFYDPSRTKEFYFRRIRRIFPVYLLTVILVVIIGAFQLVPTDFNLLRNQALTSLLGVPNFWFWSRVPYFETSEFNPLLHLWSLGVEFQFYAIVPVVYILRTRLKFSIPILIVCSILLNAWLITFSPKTAFFLLPGRLWEFLIGFMLASTKTQTSRNIVTKWLGVIGIFIIITAAYLPLDGQSENLLKGHPAFGSLITVLGCYLVLKYKMPDVVTKQNLIRILEKIGDLSYSIYLVHFPLLVLANYQPFEGTILSTSIIKRCYLLALTIFFSLLSYFLIEKPFRIGIHRLRIILFPAVLVLLALFIFPNVQKVRYSNYEWNIASAFSDRAPYRCGKLYRIQHPESQICLIGQNFTDDSRKVLLVGDSHADSIKNTFATAANKMGYEAIFVVDNGPLKSEVTVTSLINESKSKRINFWVLHYATENFQFLDKNLIARQLKNSNIDVRIILPVPEWKEHIPKALWLNARTGSALPLKTRSSYVYTLKNVTIQTSGVFAPSYIFSPVEALCPKLCKLADENGHPYYFDGHHLTLTGSKLLVPLIKQTIKSFHQQ